MLSQRLKTLAKEIDKNDIVLDVGCDHGYLSIYLEKERLCRKVYASDISSNALSYAINNFKKFNLNIETFVSDGFDSIPVHFDTAVIAGMGTTTILNILNSKKTPRKLVLCSNNEHYKLRKELNKRGYKLVDELAVLDNNRYYLVMLFIKGKQRLKRNELKFGISNDEGYYEHLYNINKKLIQKVNFKKRIILYYDNLILRGLIEKR